MSICESINQPVNGNSQCKQNAIEIDGDDFTNSSILEFLNQEKLCLDHDNGSEVDIESIFEEINRLSGGDNDERNVEDILREAELLLSRQEFGAEQQLDVHKYRRTAKNRNRINNGISLKSAPIICESETNLDETKKSSEPIYQLMQSMENVTLETHNSQTCAEKMDNIRFNSNGLSLSNTPLHSPESIPVNFYISNEISPNNLEGHNCMHSLKIENEPFPPDKQIAFSEKPKNFIDQPTSPNSSASHSMTLSATSFSRERNLEHEIEELQEKLKDTEELLQSLRLQHDTLSHAHRTLRDNQNQYVEEADRLKIDIQHLNDCATILRSELKSARADRAESLELQKILYKELDESRTEKKKVQYQSEKDVRTIQDLHRQCKEMERILLRKHPDSVSALIVASKNSSNGNEDNSTSRRLLEQRIAQLEADAREQDIKAQQILANVQTRFSTVQCKYEQHIADLETQVLSLQQINARLNERISTQLDDLNKHKEMMSITNFTQTFDVPCREEADTCSASTQTDFKIPHQTVKSTTNKKPKSVESSGKDDSHLLATIRGMRVDLAIKEKAMQRLTRELDECKKTIKKLHKEKDVMKSERSTSGAKKTYDPAQYSEQHTSETMKEYLNKIKLLEYDYNILHNKRLQDLKTLQAAHERELASCQETVRILQQRLTERDEAFALQKRRKVPIDYLALKAKVSSLERRHTEREQRLHILVEALGKGRLNGAIDTGFVTESLAKNHKVNLANI